VNSHVATSTQAQGWGTADRRSQRPERREGEENAGHGKEKESRKARLIGLHNGVRRGPGERICGYNGRFTGRKKRGRGLGSGGENETTEKYLLEKTRHAGFGKTAVIGKEEKRKRLK